jgi:hypothetical protein
MRRTTSLVLFACLTLTACGSPPPPAELPVTAQRHTSNAPPPVLATPVPIVKAKPNARAGRSDPFVALYNPGAGATTPRRVSGGAYPRIPTLPGFEGAPNGAAKPKSIWDGVRLSGIVQANGYSAIIEADGKSYVAREGDSIDDNKIRVVAIGSGYVTLSSAEGVRNFSLGG